MCRKIAIGRSVKTKEFFEDTILESAIQRHGSIATHLEDYGYMDERGFFTGTFLRELQLMASQARFSSARNTMTQETAEVIKHIKQFIAAFENKASGGEEMPADTWYKNGNISKYAILLVANPAKTQNGIDAYVNRARMQFEMGAKRVYLFGSSNESKFATAVIAGIEATIQDVKLVEKFNTPTDYRRGDDGIGAVFEVNNVSAEDLSV